MDNAPSFHIMDPFPRMADRSPPSLEPRFPIRVVAERTGLSPDVLRAWERRHGVVVPGRSEAGQRLYSESDIMRLALLARAVEGGHSIGVAATLSIDDLRSMLSPSRERSPGGPLAARAYVERAFAAVRELAPERLQGELRTGLLALGTSEFLDQLVAPLLHRIGDAWHAGDLGIAHEHAASAVVRSTLGWIIDTLGVGGDAPRLVVACLSREQHELGAMLAAAAAAQAGWLVTYLGADLPAGQLIAAARHHQVDVVAVSLVRSAESGAALDDLTAIRDAMPSHVGVFAGGAGVASLRTIPDGVTIVHDLSQLRLLLNTHPRAT